MTMFRTLLVPLDGSSLAERALPYAVRLAQSSGIGRLVLMRAALAHPPATLDGEWDRDQSQALADADEYLLEAAQRISSQVTVETAVAYGHAPAQILEAARTFDVDAVVMA